MDFLDPVPPLFVNGSARPAPLRLTAGHTHRLRLVNVRTEALTTLALVDDDAPAPWRVVAKDGTVLPAAPQRAGTAALRFAPGGRGRHVTARGADVGRDAACAR